MPIEDKIQSLGLTLLPVVKPVANYVPAVKSGPLVFLSGHGPVKDNGQLITGKVGYDLNLDEGYEAAKRAAVALLSSLKAEIGDLDRVMRIVKVFGMVNCRPDFFDHPKVINGASDLLVEIFEEKGKHARSAMGMNSLPMNMAVEIEMIVEIQQEKA
jgi:enamine deaminase RidA (YjgF/YER057c/UK114 family)